MQPSPSTVTLNQKHTAAYFLCTKRFTIYGGATLYLEPLEFNITRVSFEYSNVSVYQIAGLVPCLVSTVPSMRYS
jgi:hypothetical protein